MKWKDGNNKEYEGTVDEYLQWKNMTTEITWVKDHIRFTGTFAEKVAFENAIKEQVGEIPKSFVPHTQKCSKHWQNWTEEETNIIRNNYPNMGPNAVHTLLPNRTVEAIKTRAKAIHIKTLFRHRIHNRGKDLMKRSLWSRQEDKILRDNYRNISEKELMKLLPNRSKMAIRVRGCSMKLNNPRKIIRPEIRQKFVDRGRFITNRANNLMWTNKLLSRSQAMTQAAEEWKTGGSFGVIKPAIISDEKFMYEVKKFDTITNVETVMDTFTEHGAALEYEKYLNEKYLDNNTRYYIKKIMK